MQLKAQMIPAKELEIAGVENQIAPAQASQVKPKDALSQNRELDTAPSIQSLGGMIEKTFRPGIFGSLQQIEELLIVKAKEKSVEWVFPKEFKDPFIATPSIKAGSLGKDQNFAPDEPPRVAIALKAGNTILTEIAERMLKWNPQTGEVLQPYPVLS